MQAPISDITDTQDHSAITDELDETNNTSTAIIVGLIALFVAIVVLLGGLGIYWYCCMFLSKFDFVIIAFR